MRLWAAGCEFPPAIEKNMRDQIPGDFFLLRWCLKNLRKMLRRSCEKRKKTTFLYHLHVPPIFVLISGLGSHFFHRTKTDPNDQRLYEKWDFMAGPGFFSTSRVFFSTSGVLSLFQHRFFFLFFQPHMSFFGPHISSHVFFSTSHIFLSTSHVFLSTLYVSLSTCNVSFPSPLDWFLFGMLSILWMNVGFLCSAF